MGSAIRLLILFPVLFLSLLLQNGRCDDSVVSGNGINVFPVTSTDIQLVSETINLRYDAKKAFSAWQVDVTLNFQNFGPDTVVQIGFPFDAALTGEDEEEILPDTGLISFVDGTKVAVTHKKGIKNPALKGIQYADIYTSEIAFKSGEKKSIRHTYTVGGTVDSMGAMDFKYILKTGALWRGVIERVDVLLSTSARDLADLQYISPPPQKAERKGKDIILSWTLLNIKPDSDIVIQKFTDNLLKMSLDQLAEEILGRNKNSIYSANELSKADYFRNKVLATYGYHFTDPYEQALFYENGQFKEDPSFSWNRISTKHRHLLNDLNDNSKKRINIPKPWYQSNAYIGAGVFLILSLVLILILKRGNLG
jgi:hypothetical protein